MRFPTAIVLCLALSLSAAHAEESGALSRTPCPLFVSAQGSVARARAEIQRLRQATVPEAVLSRRGNTIVLYSTAQRDRVIDETVLYEHEIDNEVVNSLITRNRDLVASGAQAAGSVILPVVVGGAFLSLVSRDPAILAIASALGLVAADYAWRALRNFFQLWRRPTIPSVAQELNIRATTYGLFSGGNTVLVFVMPLRQIASLRGRLEALGWESGPPALPAVDASFPPDPDVSETRFTRR